eukprot:5204565-Prorocentrum_lima.AAC.1
MDVPLQPQPKEGPQSIGMATDDWSPRGQSDYVATRSHSTSVVYDSRGNWISGVEPVRFEG